MYAVIRAGGKQYRVSPGDVIHIERQPAENGQLEFTDVLAASAAEGQLSRPEGNGARVLARVLEEGRADKVLVFHYKRKKQYKKMYGHRQPYTAVRITEIAFDGQRFTAPEEPERKAKPKKAAAEAGTETESAQPQAKAASPAKKAKTKKSAAPKGKASAARKKKK